MPSICFACSLFWTFESNLTRLFIKGFLVWRLLERLSGDAPGSHTVYAQSSFFCMHPQLTPRRQKLVFQSTKLLASFESVASPSIHELPTNSSYYVCQLVKVALLQKFPSHRRLLSTVYPFPLHLTIAMQNNERLLTVGSRLTITKRGNEEEVVVLSSFAWRRLK